MDHEIYPHKCVILTCDEIVQFDDEPWCFKHSPDSGSYLLGYSAKKADELNQASTTTPRNIFENNEPEGNHAE